MLHLVLFFIFAIVCVAGAVSLLAQRHPINSALSLIVVMGSLAVLYLLLGAEFVAAIQVIVYAGAVMVLFVFVIMLLNAGEEDHSGRSRVALYIGIPSLLTLFGLIAFAVLHQQKLASGPQLPLGGGKVGHVNEIAHLLFGQFLLPFEVTSILILIAIMGAVVLARKGDE